MQLERFGRALWVGLAVLVLGACAETSATPVASKAVVTTSTVPATTAPSTTVVPATTAAPTTTTTAVPLPRRVMETEFRPFLHTEGLVLNYPTGRVERVGFHESNRAASRYLGTLPGAGEVIDLPSRERKTNARTAADVLSDPDGEVRAPITGTIKRGGTYTLYCKYTDSYLVIAPDAHPGWEVKLLHITDLTVRAGDRVEAGVTPVAAHPTRLPFHSQVEDFSAAPVWPHVHLEVDDPTIKNPPGVGGKPCS
jgi:hypothetical protein